MMEESYLDILKDWETRVADPEVYEHMDVLFPEFSFRRVTNSQRDVKQVRCPPRSRWSKQDERRPTETKVSATSGLSGRETGNVLIIRTSRQPES